jgi:curli biogenesis system outer membrane secretion channel CsgG
MKKLQYIIAPFMAAAVLVACNTQPAGPTDAELSAQVEAKVDDVKAKLKADCDANLMNAATAIKDSTIMSMGSKPAAAAKPAPAPAKPTTKPAIKPAPAPVKPAPAPAPTPVVDKKKDRFDNNGGKTVTAEDTKKKEDRFEGNGTKAVTPADTKKKEDRFNR